MRERFGMNQPREQSPASARCAGPDAASGLRDNRPPDGRAPPEWSDISPRRLDGELGSVPICPSRITSGRVAMMYSRLSRGHGLRGGRPRYSSRAPSSATRRGRSRARRRPSADAPRPSARDDPGRRADAPRSRRYAEMHPIDAALARSRRAPDRVADVRILASIPAIESSSTISVAIAHRVAARASRAGPRKSAGRSRWSAAARRSPRYSA